MRNRLVLLAAFSVFANTAFAELTFPGDEFATAKAESMGWDSKKLEAALDFAFERKSSEVVILQSGKIIAQRRRNLESASSRYRNRVEGKDSRGQGIEDVASVQKSVVSFLVGVAQEKGLISINDQVSKHLGEGWSKATADQESKITVRHLITMSSGLNSKLQYKAPAGTAWQYNTTAYSKSLNVVEKASGMSANELTQKWLTGRIGMKDSSWVKRPGGGLLSSVDANTFGFATTAPDLARFGLLMLAEGEWNGETILGDKDYLQAATDTSQKMNPSYGYLWWLNGKKAIVRPAAGRTNRSLLLQAPQDLYAAQGAMGRKVYVVPSLELVVVRLGDTPDSLGKTKFDGEFWRRIMAAKK